MMATKIFVNLPVKSLDKSIEFFTKLGFSFNQQFTNHEAACMVIGENIFAMLLVEKRFKDFTKKDICDAKKSTEVLLAQDHGWMYAHSFADLDGHQWEVLYMDESAVPEEHASEAAQQQPAAS